MTTLKRIDQITVYQQEDGQIFIYHGRDKNQFSVVTGERAIQWIKWLDILRESDNNASLHMMIEQAEMIYCLANRKNS